MSAPALNVTALIELEHAAAAMDFSFSQIEQNKGYRAALQAFNARKRRLRGALATWKETGLVKVVESARGESLPR